MLKDRRATGLSVASVEQCAHLWTGIKHSRLKHRKAKCARVHILTRLRVMGPERTSTGHQTRLLSIPHNREALKTTHSSLLLHVLVRKLISKMLSSYSEVLHTTLGRCFNKAEAKSSSLLGPVLHILRRVI